MFPEPPSPAATDGQAVSPDSLRLALWYAAWLAGTTSPDDAVEAIVGDDAAHHVVGLPGEDDAVPLALALGRLRVLGAREAAVALPVPGDLLGLAGPAEFNTEALDAEEAVVLPGAELGLVPHRAGAGVVWRVHPATSRRQVPDPHEASTTLRRELLESVQTLARLEVARWRPEVADELTDLRATVDLRLPPGLHRSALPLLAQGHRCRRIAEIALDDVGGALSAAEAEARRTALLPLERAARRALVAACELPQDVRR